MKKTNDEIWRLLSHLLSIYEIIFGFIIAGGVFSSVTAHSLLRGAAAFFFASVGLHFFVNIDSVTKEEFEKKTKTLGVGILALLIGVIAASSIGKEAAFNHVFLLLYFFYIIIGFIYYSTARNVLAVGAVTYGLLRFAGVLAGVTIAGKIVLRDINHDILYIMISYVIFHSICEHLRRSASVKSTRFSILSGFLLMLFLLSSMFHFVANIVENIWTKVGVMGFILIVLSLVSLPPLHAIKTMKAQPLFAIFPKGLAGSIILTMIFFITLQKDIRLLLILPIPAVIVILNKKLETLKGKQDHETKS